MNELIIYLIIHVVLIVPSYVLCRREQQLDLRGNKTIEWTEGDRIIWITMSLLFSPIVLIYVGGISLINYVDNNKNKPAKW